MSNNGLSDGQQSILTLVSVLLVALGGLTIPAGAPWYAALAISAFGAVGLAVKEVLGTRDGKPQVNNVQKAPVDATPSQPPAAVSPNATDFDLFHKLQAEAQTKGRTLLSLGTTRDASGNLISIDPKYDK